MTDLSQHTLRKFGFTFAIIISVLFGLIIPLLFDKPLPSWPWLIAAPFLIGAIVLPKILSLPYQLWIKFGEVAGWINTRIILSFVYYTLITPLALLLAILGKKPIKKTKPSAESYRKLSKTRTKDHMEKPY